MSLYHVKLIYKTMNVKMILLVMIVFALGLVSCSKDNVGQPNPNLSLVVRSSNYVPPLKKSSGMANVKLSDVYVNIHKIEFKLDGTESESHGDSLVSEQEMEGPFVLTLMKDSVLQDSAITSIVMPAGTYDKVEFKLTLNTTLPVEHPLYHHSLYISGSVNSKPFVLWQNAEESVKIEFPDTSAMVVGGDLFNLFIDFHTNRIVDGLIACGIDMAVDGNGNGIIEIGPNDPDGNQAIAIAALHYFKNSFDLDNDENNSNDDSNIADYHHSNDDGGSH